jgi:hypothetical protein
MANSDRDAPNRERINKQEIEKCFSRHVLRDGWKICYQLEGSSGIE